MEEKKQYGTSDIYLAAYLIECGGEWKRTDYDDDRARFIIEMDENNHSTSQYDFMEDETNMNVNARTFVHTVRMLKRAFKN